MPDQSDALWEWSVFWQSDQLQSCLPDGAAAGEQSLQRTWRGFFEALPAGAAVLDLGTGNGGLATQAVAVSKARATPFSIHGVDLADIEPNRYVSSAENLLADVNFHPRTSMEELPFRDTSFDAVASQYGIEYTNTDRSASEVLRVLKVGGCFRFLVHADDGVLKQRCRLQTDQAEQILNSDLFAASETLLRSLVDAEADRTAAAIARAERAIASTKAVIDELERRFSGDDDRSLVDKLLAAIRTFPGMRRSHSIESLLAMNETARVLLLAQSKRLKAMQSAALDDRAAEDFVKRLQSLGATAVDLETATTGMNAACVGYWLSGRKMADKRTVGDE